MDKRLIDTIEKIKTLSSQNAEFDAAMRELFGKTDSASSVFSESSDGRIDEIYEYCIEKVAKVQAELFYKDFPLKELIPGLMEDFVKMEFFHRKNLFDDFSMAVYQQIERITNAVCSNKKLIYVVSQLMGHPAYVTSTQLSDGTWSTPTISDRNASSSYSIAKLLFGKNAMEKSLSDLPAQWAVDKIYCILYYLCYQAELTSHDYNQFNEYKQIYYSIYQFRNLNHRGAGLSDDQKKTIDGIRSQIGIYYFKFMQALFFYVDGVSNGLSKIDELYNYAQGQVKKSVSPFNVISKIKLSDKDSKRFK